MPLEALLIPENLTDSDSDGIGGGTSCNFIFLLFSNPTLNDNEGELIYQISELLILVVRLGNG